MDCSPSHAALLLSSTLEFPYRASSGPTSTFRLMMYMEEERGGASQETCYREWNEEVMITNSPYGPTLKEVLGKRKKPEPTNKAYTYGYLPKRRKMGEEEKSKKPEKPKKPTTLFPHHKIVACQVEGCELPSSFSDNKIYGRWCSLHRPDQSYPLKNLGWRCAQKGCLSKAVYYSVGGLDILCCSLHLPELRLILKEDPEKGLNHPNFRRYYRLRHCPAIGCVRPTHYGWEDGPILYCNTHKKEGMIRLTRSECFVPCCRYLKCFGQPGEIPMRCFRHAKEGMIRLF